MKWTEESIRQELARLDALTGLRGRELPIRFNNAKTRLGSYHLQGDKPLRFQFSKAFFEDEQFSEHEAYDVIRHEYAHYMNHMLNGENAGRSHGDKWRACCLRVGARPVRCYDPDINEIFIREEQEKKAVKGQVDAFLHHFAPGSEITHPRFGRGRIIAIHPAANSARVEIEFGSGLQKCFAAQWLAENMENMSAQNPFIPA